MVNITTSFEVDANSSLADLCILVFIIFTVRFIPMLDCKYRQITRLSSNVMRNGKSTKFVLEVCYLIAVERVYHKLQD